MKTTSPEPSPYHFQLIDAAEAARRLGYGSKLAFKRAAEKMGLKAIQLNSRRNLYDEKDLYDFIQAKKKGEIPNRTPPPGY